MLGAIFPSFPGGGDHADLLHPRQLGGDGVHQNAGGIGRRAPGDIEAHPLQGQDLLPHEDAPLVVDQKAAAHLVLVEGGDALSRPVEDVHQGGVGSPEALLQGPGAHLHGGELHPVKLLGVFLQSGVSVGLHVGQDGPDGLRHGVHRVLPGKNRGAVGLRFLQDPNHFFSASLAATWAFSPW